MGRLSDQMLAAFLATALLCYLAAAKPDGAPQSACSSMRPGHGKPSTPQKTSSPAQYHLKVKKLDNGWEVQLGGDAEHQEYQGVLLQARALNNLSGPPLGQFEAVENAKLVDCPGKTGNNTVTHSDNTAKSVDTLKAVWKPVNTAEEKIVFVATVLQSYQKWWENITSDAVTVSVRQATGSSQKTASLELPDKVAGVYDGCFSSYGCFGQPAGCEKTKSCDVLFTYVKRDDGGISMGLMAKQENRFAAVGLSADDQMGTDGVIYCANVDGSLPALYYGYNDGRSSAYKTEENPTGVSDVITWEQDGSFMCNFIQAVDLNIPGSEAMDLSQKHYLLVATGPAVPEPQYHGQTKVASASAVDLTDTSALTVAGTPPLIYAHAICMVLAWIGMAGTGILSAQHFRLTWVGKQVLGKDVWFTVHRSLMVLTAVCTWLGFTFITVYEGKLEFDHPHSIVGFTVFLLSILQVLGGMVRPNPTAKLRPLFNWGHRLAGLSAYILAMTTLFLAKQLPQLNLTPAWMGVLAGSVGLDVSVSLALVIHELCIARAGGRVEPAPGFREKTEAPGAISRKIVLGVYIISSLGLVTALIVLILLAGN